MRVRTVKRPAQKCRHRDMQVNTEFQCFAHTHRKRKLIASRSSAWLLQGKHHIGTFLLMNCVCIAQILFIRQCFCHILNIFQRVSHRVQRVSHRVLRICVAVVGYSSIEHRPAQKNMPDNFGFPCALEKLHI